MDILFLSRMQFAVTAAFHFIFVPLTLGLSWIVAFMEWRYVRTEDVIYLRMTKFWGKLFLINFALGVVTGITMEFQIGMNWAEYSRYVGDIFGAPLAIEATLAFFLESTFIGVWIFGWNRISKKMHAVSMTIVAFATNLSALWILLANGWQQHPVGYVLRNGRAEMVDFIALFTNPNGIGKFFHTVVSGYVIGAFFVMAISAYHISRKNEVLFFKKSFKYSAVFALFSSLLIFISGDLQAITVAKTQPSKFAAIESRWNTEKNVPYSMIVIPDPANEKNSVEALSIPGALSYLAYQDSDAEVKGLKDFKKEDRPPVMMTFLGFRLMVLLGGLFLLASIIAVYLSIKDKLEQYPFILKIILLMLPLPYIAGQAGWIVAEVGRQPWVVYGLMRTSEGVSKSLELSQVISSLGGFILLYGTLAVVDIYLLTKFAKKGPDQNVSDIVKMTRV